METCCRKYLKTTSKKKKENAQEAIKSHTYERYRGTDIGAAEGKLHLQHTIMPSYELTVLKLSSD